MIQSIELRHSPWINDIDKPNILENNTYRSFNLMFNTNIDRLSMLIHFKELKIHEMQLYYRKNGTRSNKATKVYPQHKMRLSFNNTLELLEYLSNKNYNVDWFNIKFENGWHIEDQTLISNKSSNKLSFKSDEIAFASDFNSVQNFYRVFKEHTGITPKIFYELNKE